MSGLRLPVSAFVVAALGGCGVARTQEQAPMFEDQVAGCYQIEVYPGRTGPEAERDRASWGKPPLIKLETARLTGWPGLEQRYERLFIARTIVESGQVMDHPFGYWRPLDQDSLYVGHPGALAGIVMVLSLEGQDLRGEITSFTDVLEPGKPSKVTAPVLARRVDCPAEEE